VKIAPQNLVTRLSTRFNLNADEVEAVFQEAQIERQEQRKAALSERLQQKVNEGEITAEQKTLIESKLGELQAEHEEQRTALESWAEENGISQQYIMFGRGRADRASDRLQSAVNNGEITAEQKTLIESKIKEIATEREQDREELRIWFEQNNINMSDILPGDGFGKGTMRHHQR